MPAEAAEIKILLFEKTIIYQVENMLKFKMEMNLRKPTYISLTICRGGL